MVKSQMTVDDLENPSAQVCSKLAKRALIVKKFKSNAGAMFLNNENYPPMITKQEDKWTGSTPITLSRKGSVPMIMNKQAGQIYE